MTKSLSFLLLFCCSIGLSQDLPLGFPPPRGWVPGVSSESPQIKTYVIRSTNGLLITKSLNNTKTTLLPPAPPGLKVSVIPRKARSGVRAAVSIPALTPVHIQTFNKSNTIVIYGKLAPIFNNQLFRTASASSGIESLPIAIAFKGNQPIIFGDEVVFCNVIDISVIQLANFGVKIEYSDNLKDWGAMGGFGTYPFDQPVGITWIRPVTQDYPKVFFKAYKY